MRISLLGAGGTDQAASATYEWGPSQTVNWIPKPLSPAEPRRTVLVSPPTIIETASLTVSAATSVNALVLGYSTDGSALLVAVTDDRSFVQVVNLPYSGSAMAANTTPTMPLPIAASGPDGAQVICGDQYWGGVPWLGDVSSRTQTSLATQIATITNVTFFGQRFVAGVPNTNQFRWSDLNDGASWPALNVASAEHANDALKAVVSNPDVLAVVGTETTEFWSVTLDANAPYSRINAATVPVGTSQPASVVPLDGAFYFTDALGHVFEVSPGKMDVVSTTAIESRIRNEVPATNVTHAAAMHLGAEKAYVLTPNTTNSLTALVYFPRYKEWIDWGELTTVTASATLPNYLCATATTGLISYVGNRSTAYVGHVQNTVASTTHPHRRITPNVSVKGALIRWNEVRAQFGGATPSAGKQAHLSYSDDGGGTWSTRVSVNLPTSGSFAAQPSRWPKLGLSRERCFRIEVDAGDYNLVDLWAEVEVMGQ